MYKWEILNQKISKKLDPSNGNLINLLLTQLGIESNKEADLFLHPELSKLNDPYLFFEIKKTAHSILDAIKNKKKIFIHGDYDVDGIVATSIVWDFLYRKLGADILPIVPNRFDDGYGLSENTIAKIKEKAGQFVITVDCGIKDNDLIEKHPELDFVITDHHTFPTDNASNKLIPSASNIKGIVHPQDPRGKYPFDQICGATVAWKLLTVLAKEAGIEFDILEYLDLIALATTTDIMPLINENRIILTHGISRIRTTENPSILALLEVAQVEQDSIDAYHFGFVIGPRLNAAGRIDDAMEAVRLLSTNNHEKAREISKRLNDLNIQRQEITADLLEIALKQIIDQNEKLHIVVGDDWPEGVIGLIAGKLQEKFSKPIIVASINTETNEVIGSARSPESFNITEALNRHKHLLNRFGGHCQAAGFSLHYDNFVTFSESIKFDALNKIEIEDLLPVIKINSTVEISDIDDKFIESIEKLAPFGFGNPTPKFLFKNVEVSFFSKFGKQENHIRIVSNSRTGKMTFVGFNIAENFDSLKAGDKIDIVGVPKFNVWNNKRTIQIDIKDYRKSDEA